MPHIHTEKERESVCVCALCERLDRDEFRQTRMARGRWKKSAMEIAFCTPAVQK